MKKTFLFLFLAGALTMSACKGKDSKSEETTTTTGVDTTTTYQAPVDIAADTTLTAGLRDATKDYPGVTATVDNGEVTLTGTIERDRLPRLMQAVQSLQPKKVNNNLTIQ
jgi:osmotically-inducible protein OsmY